MTINQKINEKTEFLSVIRKTSYSNKSWTKEVRAEWIKYYYQSIWFYPPKNTN